MVLVLVAVWAAAPTAGSPASLVVMPIVAALAVWQATDLWRAELLAIGTLLPVAVGYTVVTMLREGSGILGPLGTGAGIFAMHAVAVAVLVALAWGLARFGKRAWHAARSG